MIAAGVALAGLAAVASAAPASSADIGTLSSCLETKDVPIKLTSDSDYSALAQPYNLRLPYSPAVIVLPTTNQHVQDAVTCAGSAGYKVQAKGGGHSYASFSSGGVNGSVEIFLQEFNDVTLDTSTNIVTVGGGVRLGNLAQGIYDQGKRALPHGTCPGVGIGGHATHGGYGYTSRTWGLALDTIVAVDVVLANGTLVHATSSAYPDVYWAVRGAADSFGIVTNFYLQTLPAPDTMTFFSFGFSGLYDTKEIFTNSILHIQEASTNASIIDERIAHGWYLDGSTYTLHGSFDGPIDEFQSKIQPELLRTLPTPASSTVETEKWIDYLVNLAGEPSLTEPLTGYSAHDTFSAKSITVPEKDGWQQASIEAFYDYITQGGAPDSWFSIINLYGGPKSAINSKDTSFSSYADRSALWVFQNYGEGTDTQTWLDGLNKAVTDAQPNTVFGAYLNYVDPSLSAAEAHQVYYGTDVYNRLAELKKVIDPQSVFWNPQAIGA